MLGPNFIHIRLECLKMNIGKVKMKLELGCHVEQKLTLIQQDRRFSSFVLFQVNLLIRFSLGEIMQFYGKT